MSKITRIRADLPDHFRCGRCQQFKLRDQFYTSKHTIHGICGNCKSCESLRHKPNPKYRPNSRINSRINLDFPGKYRCSRCEQFKSREQFSVSTTTALGIPSHCKECAREIKGSKKHILSRTSPEFPGLFRCPDCSQFKPREQFHVSRKAYHGISVYCAQCVNIRRQTPPRSTRSTCVLCSVEKQASEMWRYLKWRGEPVCKSCFEEYCKKYDTRDVPKYFVRDGRRVCARCKANKETSEFAKSPSEQDVYFYCLECADKSTDEYRKKYGLPMSNSIPDIKAGTKRCGRCGEVHPIEFFYQEKNRGDGLRNHCKLCDKFRNRIRYMKNGAEYARNWQRNFSKTQCMTLKYWEQRVDFDHFIGISGAEAMDLFVSHQYCEYCHIKLAGWQCQLDHRVPHKRGGKNEISNIAISCGPCNRAKSSMTDVEYKSYLEELRVRLNQIAACKKVIRKRVPEWDITEIITKAV